MSKQKTQAQPNDSEIWKSADLRKWVKNDLKAAIALLDLIQSNEELFNLVCVAIEGWREKMIENEQKAQAPLMPVE